MDSPRLQRPLYDRLALHRHRDVQPQAEVLHRHDIAVGYKLLEVSD